MLRPANDSRLSPSDLRGAKQNCLIPSGIYTDPGDPQYASPSSWLRTDPLCFQDSDVAQLMAIKAGLGIGIYQVPLACKDPNLRRVLAGMLELKLGVWAVMHENFRSTPRCRAVFDGHVAGLKAHID